MTLPTSGTLTLQMIQDEFLAPRGTGILNFLKGGAYVPNNAANTNVPSSPPIGTLSFYGASRTGGGPGGGLAATKSNDVIDGVTIVQPSPPAATMGITSYYININVSGGTGAYTCTWTHLSGSTGISTPGANQFHVNFFGTVARNSNLAAVKRCTVSDGVNSVIVDVNVSLTYNWETGN